MKYSIKTPIFTKDIPDFFDIVFSGKTNDVVKKVIETCTIDENGNPVSTDTMTVRETMALIPEAMKALGFSEDAEEKKP